MELLYKVTHRCDRNCLFCYNHVFENKIKIDVEEKTNIDFLIEFIIKNNIERVSISGGEPAVRKDLLTLVSRISQVSLIKIFTNGLLVLKYDDETIINSGISKIVLTIYDDYIYGNDCKWNILKLRIQKLREKGIIIDGNLFLDNDYLKKRDMILKNDITEVFDNIRWQPLVLPQNHYDYNKTIFGMGEGRRTEIFESVIQDDWGDVARYYKMFEKWIRMGKQPYPCTYPQKVYTVNPDLSFQVCPHISTLILPDDELECGIGEGCLSPQCMSIYSWN